MKFLKFFLPALAMANLSPALAEGFDLVQLVSDSKVQAQLTSLGRFDDIAIHFDGTTESMPAFDVYVIETYVQKGFDIEKKMRKHIFCEFQVHILADTKESKVTEAQCQTLAAKKKPQSPMLSKW